MKLVDVCPYGPYGPVVWSEELQLPQTWIFDAHLLDRGWREPRCVTACPTRAIRAMKLDDAAMAELAQRDGLRPLRPELGTRPRVHYRNLQRADSLFVAGSVVKDGDCVEDADVQLESSCGGGSLYTRADAFGDFRFDGLAAGTHAPRVTHGGRHTDHELTLGSESAVLPDLARV